MRITGFQRLNVFLLICFLAGCGTESSKTTGGGAPVLEEGFGAIELQLVKSEAEKPDSVNNKIPSNATGIILRIWNDDGYDEKTKIKLDNTAQNVIIPIPEGVNYKLDATSYEYSLFHNNETKSILTAGRTNPFDITAGNITEIDLTLNDYLVNFAGTDTEAVSGNPFTVQVTVTGADFFPIAGDTAYFTAAYEPWSNDGGFKSYNNDDIIIDERISLTGQDRIINEDGSITFELSFEADAPVVTENKNLYYQLEIISNSGPSLYLPSLSAGASLGKVKVNASGGISIVLN